MKILYGIQGTGNGHISRARMMAHHFRRKNADVTYLFTGRDPARFFDMEVFGDFQHRRGLTFTTNGGRIQYLRTLQDNSVTRALADIRNLDVASYDLVITDFEPVAAWAGRRAGKTVIGIGHQYAFGYEIPLAGANPVSRGIMRYFAPASISIGLHWSHFNAPIAPPIIDPSLAPAPAEAAHVLVYLPFEDQQRVTQLLQQLGDYRFRQYSSELEDAEAGNVSLRKTCLEGFKRDLKGAQAVISNAGFELVSECLHLGIPVLVKPLQGQMEQLSNAAALEQLGLARSCDAITATTLGGWLAAEKTAPAVSYPDVADALTDWVLTGDWSDPGRLTRQLWH